MKGSLQELSEGHWRLRVFAGREAGKVRQVSRNFKGTKRQAESALAKLVADVERQQVATGRVGTLGELVDQWLEDMAPHRSSYTMREYRRIVAKAIKPALGGVRIDKINGRHLDNFYRRLYESGLSGSSVHQHHSVVHASFGRAVKWGLLPFNPADRATAPRPARSTASAPALADVQRLVAEAEKTDTVLAIAVALAAITGARRGELCALRWSDVNWPRGTLTIARSLTVVNKQVAEEPTKTHQRRDIAIDEALGTFLTRRRGEQDRYAETVGVQLVDDPFILSRAAEGSEPCLPDGLTHQYERLASNLGLTSHLHELRHFSATAAIAGGADVRTVAGRLGHAGPSVTLRVYSHVLEARDRELAGMLGRAVLGPVRGSAKLDEADPPAPAQLEATAS
ncbi:MAG: tyrosine-type recombinase/integrase [Acidimicrobiales bacterium]